ncbi:autotransporter assembly complex protein TamB [Vibrio sonorensis]|uniref:autotransporter assembly complex protein TamB n=1 Tax=Vibrio sonorensis TaxID=1004316 RepID=UPI0008DA447C|nr:translocation/assembly module TamB domain-containing protein [Vibrio sonorensis]
MRPIVVKWLKWASKYLLGFTAFFAILVVGLLFTPLGLSVSLYAAQHFVPQLEVEDSQGALLTGFNLKGVSYVDESSGLVAHVDSAGLRIRAACITEPAVCVDSISVEGLALSLASQPESTSSVPDETNTQPQTPITAPIPIRVNRIALNNIKLDILGHQVSWQTFSTGVRFQGSRLRIANTEWANIDVKLAAPESGQASDSSKTNGRKPAEDISLPQVTIPLAIELAELNIRDFVLDGSSPVQVYHLGLKAKARGHTVEVDHLVLDMPEADAELFGNIELSGDYPLSLDLKSALKVEPLAGQKLSVKLQGSVADLNVDTELTDLITGNLKASLSPLQHDLPFDVLLRQTKLQWPLAGDAQYHADIASLAVKGSLDGYQLDLSGQLDGQQIPQTLLYASARGDLNQINISELDLETLGGELSAKAKVNWQAPLNWSAVLSMKNIQPGLQWPDADGAMSGHISTFGELTEQGGWKVSIPELNIDGVIREYPLVLEGVLNASDTLGNGNIHMDTQGLTLAHGPNTLEVRGEVRDEIDLRVNVAFEALSRSVPDLVGRVNGVVGLTGTLEHPSAAIALNANQVQWQDQIAIASLKINGDLQPTPQPNGQLQVELLDAIVAEQKIQSLIINFDGEQEKHSLSVDLLSDLISTSIAVNGGLKLDPKLVWSGELSRVQLSTEQGEWYLDKSTDVSFDGDLQQAFIDEHCWRQERASLCLEAPAVVGETGEIQLSLNQFDFQQIAMFVPDNMTVEGGADVALKAGWSPNNPPEVEALVDIPKGRFSQTLEQESSVTLGWNQSYVNAQLDKGVFSANWLFDIVDNGDLSGRVKITDVQSEDRQLDGKLSLSSINLDFLAPLLGDYSKLAANIHSDLVITGDVLQPQVTGNLVAEDILLKGDISPVQVDTGGINLTFNGYQADLDASLVTPDGKLSISGDADWTKLEQWQSQLRIFAKELKVEMPPMVRFKVTPDMKISLSPHQILVDGNISLPWGRVVVEALPESAIGVSKDQVILNANLEPIEGRNEIPFNIESNINISIGDDFKISAFGLEGGLKGNLDVTQKNKGPFILGEVNIVDGTYRSFGQDLIISEGKVLMNGPADQPYVAITAIRNPDNTQDDVTAGVKVTGSADAPTMTIFSEPAMPQANALSYLLRGQDIDGEAGGNAMTTTLIGLSLAKSGRVVGEIGAAFGVQDLQLDTAGSGDDSQVTVSGYVLPGLQVKYGVGIFDSVGEFTVRYRLMQDLYVEAISGLDSAVDLLYQFEFN